MKLRKYYILDNDIYTVRMNTEDWSQRDQELMVNFGEPEIDLGGDFLDLSTSTPTIVFTLPHRLVRIMTDSPFSQGFDERDYPTTPTAEERANLWADTISDRVV